jgi:hypothetical protein
MNIVLHLLGPEIYFISLFPLADKMFWYKDILNIYPWYF